MYNRRECYSEVQVLQNTLRKQFEYYVKFISLIIRVKFLSYVLVLFLLQNSSYYSDIIKEWKHASSDRLVLPFVSYNDDILPKISNLCTILNQ
jgi:hypothetical protein